MRSKCCLGFFLMISFLSGLDVSLAMPKDELDQRRGQLEAQLKSAIESYTMAKKIYEESLRSKDSVDLRRSQYFEAKNRVKRLHGELRALGIKSEYLVIDEKIKKLMESASDVPRGTDQ